MTTHGFPSEIRGTAAEIFFLTFVVALNMTLWAYLMGSISGG